MTNQNSKIKTFSFPCDVPDISWWSISLIPNFRTVKSLGYQNLQVSTIRCTNTSGQINNSARSLGTDNVNFSALRDSFLGEGINSSFLPPVVLKYYDADGNLVFELLDGFTRHSVLSSLAQEIFTYLVVELKDGFTVDDARDEVGLGCNNHPQSKKHTITDFKKRFANYVKIRATNGEVTTSQDGISWFNRIPNSFDEEKIADTVDKVLNEKRAADTMQSYTNKTAKKRGAELLQTNREVLAFDNKTGASLSTCLIGVISHYVDTGEIPDVVGFLKATDAEDAESVRSQLETQVNELNEGLRLLSRNFRAADKRKEKYEFIRLKGFIPQIVDVETDPELV